MNMEPLLQIRPHYRVEIIEPNHVYLLAENATHALTGEFYCHLMPLLDGQYTYEEICERLTDHADRDQVAYVIENLYDKGYIAAKVPELSDAAAAFWSLLGVEPQTAYDCLRQVVVYVTAVGNVPTQPLTDKLTTVGIQTQPWTGKPPVTDLPTLLVVLTDDYLQPELAQINQVALDTNQAWLLAKPIGGLLWFGPIFEPGITGCWQCLAHRLRGNREVEASVLKQKGKAGSVAEVGNRGAHQPAPLTPQSWGEQAPQASQLKGESVEFGQVTGCLPTSNAFLSSTLETGVNLVTTEVAKWIVQLGVEETANLATLVGKVITLNQTNLSTETHQLPHRPQCAACGNPQLLSDRAHQPVSLVNRKKQYTTDGGHRAFTPDQTLKRYQHLVSPITGVVSALIRSSDPDSALLHTYHAIHSYGAATNNLNRLRRMLGHKSAGKGKTDRQAKASGFCEAVERYSSIYHGDEPLIVSTLGELGDTAIPPEQVMQFSEYQYAHRETLNKARVDHNWVPQRFDSSQAIEWTPVWSLVTQTHSYLPTAFCYYNYPASKDHHFCSADSNGNAAGNTLEEAILQGFMELVERDSVAIWWYNSLQCPGVDLASFDDPYLVELQQLYRDRKRDLWVLDITSDLGIPAFAAISARTDQEQEGIIAGFGAHLDPRIAILRAVTEMNQLGFHVDEVEPSKTGSWEEWNKHNLNRKDHPYIVANPDIPLKLYSDYAQQWSDDIYEDVMTCVKIAQSAGMETLVLDQTRPDIGLNVVKVIVPGMRHFWARFAPGRLYDVPVKLGLFAEPLTEDQLNLIPMIL
ncbi:MAG: TOMM precursor leader peptide-binding protein [Moorea sp. SIO3H5]|nr:TOMM precursor leader peptide-binding protein [Moorena sp. SIO3H5]